MKSRLCCSTFQWYNVWIPLHVEKRLKICIRYLQMSSLKEKTQYTWQPGYKKQYSNTMYFTWQHHLKYVHLNSRCVLDLQCSVEANKSYAFLPAFFWGSKNLLVHSLAMVLYLLSSSCTRIQSKCKSCCAEVLHCFRHLLAEPLENVLTIGSKGIMMGQQGTRKPTDRFATKLLKVVSNREYDSK